MSLSEKVFSPFLAKGIIKKKSKLMIGLSGGPDSIFLFYLCLQLRKIVPIKLFALHFNHCLRPEADREENFVKEICDKEKVEFISQKIRNPAKLYGNSLEQQARNARYEFFVHTSRQLRARILALAHHKDDLAETVLMRIIRGTGLRGLRAILPISRYRNITIIRPLLDIEKKDILLWLNNNNITYCLDPSNEQVDFLRNRIRHEIIPVFKQINPNIVDALTQLAQLAGEDYQFIEEQAQKKLKQLAHKSAAGIKININEFSVLPPALKNEILRQIFALCKGDTRRLELRHLEEVYSLISNQRPDNSIVHLPGLEIIKKDNWLFIKSLIL